MTNESKINSAYQRGYDDRRIGKSSRSYELYPGTHNDELRQLYREGYVAAGGNKHNG